MNLRRVLLVSTAFSNVMLAGATGAFAQDYDWSGFYVGVGVGAAASSSGGVLSWFDPENAIWGYSSITGNAYGFTGDLPVMHNGELDPFPGAMSGFGLTGSVGFNSEMDNFLIGIEASVMTGPIKAEDTFRESGTVTYTTVTTSTSYLTSSSFEPLTTVGTTYLSSIGTSTLTFTHTSTITSTNTTTTFTYTDTFTSFQTTQTINPSTTIEFPTSTISTVLTTTTTGSVTNVSTTSISTHVLTTSTSYSESTFTTNGEWTETITGRAQIDWLATIKGRIGITADRALFFVSGGLAVGQVTQSTDAEIYVDNASGGTTSMWHGENTETKFGFVVGAGAEFALDDHWILSGEAEYYNLGSVQYGVTASGGGAIGTGLYGTQTQNLDGGSVKVGVKYKFD